MAEIMLPAQQLSSVGVEPNYYDSTSAPALSTGDFSGSGDQFAVSNDGKTRLHVKNGATELNITVQTTLTEDGLDLPDRTITVPADEERDIYLQRRDLYGDPFKFALDSVASVEVAVLKL